MEVILEEKEIPSDLLKYFEPIPDTAPMSSVQSFPTQPYPEAHFAVFPEKLPEICIKAASKPDDLILDPFMGAGTTLWVAKKLTRKAVGYEISEEYCKLALERNRQQVMFEDKPSIQYKNVH